MISISHMETLSKSKPTDVWCLDSLGEHSIRFDRLSLCSQIKAIPIEEVVAMLTELKLEIEKLQGKYSPYYDEASQHTCEIIQQKINALKENKDGNDY